MASMARAVSRHPLMRYYPGSKIMNGLKSGGRGSGFQNGGLWVIKVQQMEGTQPIFEGIIPFIFNSTQIILFLKSHHSGKCSRIPVHIIGYNIPWRPQSKNGGLRPPNPPRFTPMTSTDRQTEIDKCTYR